MYIFVPPPDNFFQTSYQAKLSRSPSDRPQDATPPAHLRLNKAPRSPTSPSQKEQRSGSQVDQGSTGNGSTGTGGGSELDDIVDKGQEKVKPAMELVTGSTGSQQV